MHTLADPKLIELSVQVGYPNIVSLRDESGSGGAYGLPATAYSFGETNRASKEDLGAQT